MRFTKVAGDTDWGPLRLVGRWHIQAEDERFAGLSSLAIDSGGLIAISDSGSVARFPFPGGKGSVRIADLPSGPGSPQKKAGRDAEAMATDPAGRGIWVGFENGHELRLFDRDFHRTLQIISLRSQGWSRNRGVEGMSAGNVLRIFPEPGSSFLEVDPRDGRTVSQSLGTSLARLGDVAILPDGREIAVTRRITPFGIQSRIMIGESGASTWRELARLPLGRWSNPEGLAVERRADGAARLWIVTDNDFRRRVPTELIALDYKP